MDPYPPPSSMTLSPQSPPVGQQPSTVFRPRRSDDWHEYREIIEQLYRNDQLKLRDVKRIMERDYKFYASEKQYKDRLAAWHVRKNIKAKEVHLMIRKQQKRAARGKETAFRVNGQNVDPKRIARFLRRYGNSWDQDRDRDAEDQSPEPKTPSDMTCYTPEPEENAVTPVSPPDVQSPTRETSTYPLSYDPTSIDTLPDLVIDDEHNSQHTYPLHMHSNSQSRRPFHTSPESTMQPLGPPPSSHHPPAHQTAHSRPHSDITHSLVHPLPLPSMTASSQNSDHPPHQHHPGVLPLPGPTLQQHQHQHQQHQHQQHQHQQQHQHRLSMNGHPDLFTHTHPNSYASLDAFQSRLGELQNTLNESMAKWSRDQDPNQEIPHHEGLGL